MKKIEKVNSDTYTDEAVALIRAHLEKRDKGKPFHMFLSGGSTPKAIYAQLAKGGLDWSNVHLWWGDERFVPSDHPDSNARMVREHLLDSIELPPAQVHPWPILSTPELSAQTYDREFRTFFDSDEHSVNLQLLGMGDDGHTASLFPDTEALQEKNARCVANHVKGKESVRLTLTYPALALSQSVIFLVKGEGKAEALRDVYDKGLHPAAKVEGQQSTLFLIDEGAGKHLKG